MVIAVNAGVKLSTIASSFHIYRHYLKYPNALQGRYLPKRFLPRTKNILKFIFSLRAPVRLKNDHLMK